MVGNQRNLLLQPFSLHWPISWNWHCLVEHQGSCNKPQFLNKYYSSSFLQKQRSIKTNENWFLIDRWWLDTRHSTILTQFSSSWKMYSATAHTQANGTTGLVTGGKGHTRNQTKMVTSHTSYLQQGSWAIFQLYSSWNCNQAHRWVTNQTEQTASTWMNTNPMFPSSHLLPRNITSIYFK